MEDTKITAEDVEILDSDATALILNIMQQNARDANFTTEALMNGYRNSQLRAEATIHAIRWNVQKLFKDGYQPSESAILNAIWPTHEQIEDFMEEFIND
jgi:hypothetical protein